jgi:hypothetical protein
MGFCESLPTGCPPADSHDLGCDTAFRLISNRTPTRDDFTSYAAKQESMPPNVDPCRWASCSLFADLETIVKKRSAFKKLKKYKFAAELTIPPGSGRICGDSHLDFWMYDTFNPLQAIAQIREL